MPQRTIAIGDIHGCSTALDTLIEAIDPGADDLLIPLGDYVDRGPDSRGVIDRLLALAARCSLVPLLGNHELMLLAAVKDREDEAAAFWRMIGGAETLASYGGSIDNIPVEHLDFFGSLRRYYQTPNYLFFHANYVENVPPEEQPENCLLWQHLHLGLPGPHVSGKTVVVGHTPQTSGEIFDGGHILCIDTFCFGGGWLTALEVETRQIWQANNEGQLMGSEAKLR